MKKVLSLFLTFLLSLSLGISAMAAEFSDLPQEHWAYQNVFTLVNEGTVNGYEDGTFQPSKTVTRAEFVKMIGKWNVAYEGEITDLAPEHWAYDYLIWSGLTPEGTNIYPDRAILRSEVINLIWKRNGSPLSKEAPGAIVNQGTNPDATSWAYTIGLIQGDDGFNLRLSSSLTRAEAATLIIRSRALAAANQKHSFGEVVSKEITKTVYEMLNLFPQKPYVEETTLTNAEVAHAAMLISAGGKSISYGAIKKPESLISHTYAKDMYVLSNQLWGEEYNTVAMANKTATLQDTVSAFVFGLALRGGNTIALDKTDAFYSDCVQANSTELENRCLSFAASNDIRFTPDETLGATKEATIADVALLMILIDDAVGFELGFANETAYNKQINKNPALYPANYQDYKLIKEGVPASVYQLKQSETKPKDYHNVASELSFVFSAYLDNVKYLAKAKNGVNMDLIYYPSLCYQENNAVTFIAECIVHEQVADLDAAFAPFLKEKTGLQIEPGKTFYVEFQTYVPLMDIFLPAEAAYVKNIIIPE